MTNAAKFVLPHLLFGVKCIHGYFYPLLSMKGLRRIFPPIIVEVYSAV